MKSVRHRPRASGTRPGRLRHTPVERPAGYEPEALERRTLLSSATLVADVNASPAGAGLSGMTAVGGTLYFTAHAALTGRELWKTDGTPGGTSLVKDLFPGFGSGDPRELTPAGDVLYFVANDGAGRVGLFKTDGSGAGTVKVKDLAPANPPYTIELERVGGTLFISIGRSPSNEPPGAEPSALWASDGTEAGTAKLMEFPPANQPRGLTAFAGALYFSGYDVASGTELWWSDGTAGGTARVKDVNPGTASSVPNELTVAGGRLYFTANTSAFGRILFTSDGTEAGTVDVADANGARMPLATELAAGIGLLFFSTGATGTTGAWRTDGTPAGTYRLAQGGFDPETGVEFTAAGPNVFFTSRTTSLGPPVTRDLWVTDGTSQGTELIRSFAPNHLTNIDQLTAAGDRLFFTADNNAGLGNELWVSDGTAGGTRRVIDLNPGAGTGVGRGFGSTSARLAPLGDVLLFAGTDGQSGFDLFKSDGTAEGTVPIADIPGGTNGSSPGPAVRAGGVTYFAASRPDVGAELFRTDGTSGGTALVEDINPGTGDAAPQSLVALGDLLVFTAADAANNRELWRSDGTPEGTYKLKDIYPFLSSVDFPKELTVFNGLVYFRADDGTYGEELWRTDGTPEETVRVTDGNPDGGNFWPSELTVWNGALYFRAEAVSNDSELYRSDGTAEGTVRVKDLVEGTTGSSPREFTPMGDGLYFIAHNPAALWKTDGTEGGTVPVKTINLSNLNAADSRLFFEVLGAGGDELWASDGTEAGTAMVRPFNGTRMIGFESAAVNGVLVFDARDSEGGSELWRSDGTPEGTYRLKDINPGPADSRPVGLRVVPSPAGGGGELAYFAANDGANGSELWVTDGTSGGTRLALDLYPGPTGSAPQNLANVGGALWLSGDHPLFGRELWKLGPLPVSQVLVSGSSWGAPFLDHLRAAGRGDGGFALPDPLTDAPPPLLPWANVNQVKAKFDGDVVLSPDALRVLGTRPGGYAASGFAYDPATRTATWTLATPLGPDRLGIDVGRSAVWLAEVLPGDVDGNGAVNIFDTLAARNRQGTSTTNAGTAPNTYSIFHDVDGNGAVNIFDTLAVRNRQGTSLPAAGPAPLSAAAAPARSPFGSALIRREGEDEVRTCLA